MDSAADRMIALPDDVLVLILEKLGSACEAIRTCSLVSRRWSQLPWLLPEPKISIGDFLPQGTELYELDPAEAQLGQAMGAFCRAVSSFMANATETSTTTRCLSLDFCLANGCLPTVQRLLGGDGRTTAARKVGALQLTLRTAADEEDVGEALMRRYARRFERFMDACPCAFRLLTGLELWNLWLGSASVAAVLGACPRLGRLALRHCYGARGEALVVDAPPRSALAELALDMCFYRLVVVRSAPELTRLACDMWSAARAPLSLRGVPRLETLVLSNPASAAIEGFRLSKLLANASLRRLSLNFHGEKIWIHQEPPRLLRAAFGKLTSLSIVGIPEQCDLLCTMFLLEAAPFLQEFSVGVQKHFCHGEEYSDERKCKVHWTQSNFRHNHLKNLQVFGFEVEDKYMTFARLVMERATNLKTVILADEEPCQECDFASDPASSRYPKNKDEKSSIVKQLKDELSSSVEIYIQ